MGTLADLLKEHYAATRIDDECHYSIFTHCNLPTAEEVNGIRCVAARSVFRRRLFLALFPEAKFQAFWEDGSYAGWVTATEATWVWPPRKIKAPYVSPTPDCGTWYDADNYDPVPCPCCRAEPRS